MQIDETKEQLTVEVAIDRHVPIAVFKSFVKMALFLLPEAEIGSFAWTLGWPLQNVHTRPFIPTWHRSFTPLRLGRDRSRA